jgi:hypothetical protein
MIFRDHLSTAKHETREYLLSQITTLNKRKFNVLSLPSTNFIFEKMVLNKYSNVCIDCMEYDMNIYNEMKNNLPVKVNYEMGDVFDKAYTNPYKYDFIWFDLCGNLSCSTFNNFLSITQNCLKDRSIVALTLNSSREQRTKKFVNVFNCNNGDQFRFDVFPQTVVNTAKLRYPNFSLINIIKYKNERKKSVPMSLYVFKTF